MVAKDSIIDYVNENLSNTNEVAESIIPISDKITPLIWLLVANIIILLIKFIVDIKIKNKDIGIHRKGLINQFIIETEKELFYKLEKLSKYDSEQTEKLLTEILAIEKYSRINRIFIRKDICGVSIKILDYYKEVSGDYTRKNIDKENKLMVKYSDKFYE